MIQVGSALMQTPEIQRIFKELSGKTTFEQKEKAAQELQYVYYKYQVVSEEIFTKLQKMINNSDPNEKMGGILGLNYLSSAVQESQVVTLVNRFLSVVFSQFSSNTDEKLMRKNAEVFGKLVRQGGSKIAQLVDSNFVDAMKMVKMEVQRERKLAGLLVLKEMLVEAPSITFNKLLSSQNLSNLTPVFQAIRSKHLSLREVALDFFNECVKQVTQRELKYQQEILLTIYKSEIKKNMQNKDEEFVHGNLLMLKILLQYSHDEVFVDYIGEICQYVLYKKDTKIPLLIRAVIETLPTLARYSRGQLLLEFVDTSIILLLQQSTQAKSQKDKQLCYSTLSELFALLNEHQLVEKAKLVVKHIREELIHRFKPFCVETIQCLRVIFQIHSKRFISFTNIDVLVDQILLNGLQTESIGFLNDIQKALPEISEIIQLKLISTIYAVLLHRLIAFVQPQQGNSRSNKKFDMKVLETFQASLHEQLLQSSDFTSPEAVGNAIQTLSTFVFETQQDILAVLVKDAVLPQLADPNPIIRKAAAKAGCLLYVKKNRAMGEQMISKKVMYEILDKFMNVAIADPDQEIRHTMLSSLNENFDQYLKAPSNLRKLFLCMNDPVAQVQEIALTVLCRLSLLNPAEIVPFLKKTLFEYLQTLTYESQPDKQTVNQLYLLSSLIKHGKDIVKPYTVNIAKVLLQHLQNQNISGLVMDFLLRSFSQLTENSKEGTLVYLDEVLAIIIGALQDKSSTMKREAAVRSLNDIIKNTGFVVLPYYHSPNLMDVILQLVRTEVTLEMRLECLRLLGNIGTIDSFNYKRTMHNMKHKIQNGSQVVNGWMQYLPQKFRFIESYQNAIQTHNKNELVAEIHSYYEDLILMGGFQDQKRMLLHLAQLKRDTHSTAASQTLPRANESYHVQEEGRFSQLQQYYLQAIQSSDLDELFSQSPIIQLSMTNIDYYSTIVIKTLLLVLLDSSLQPHHELALETLMWIIGTLKSKTSAYLQYLLPVFAVLLQRFDDIRDKLLSNMEKMIRLCGIQFGQQYIDQVIGCVMLFAQGRIPGDLPIKTANVGLEILGTLIQFSKAHLRHKVEPLVRYINNQIVLYEDNKDILKKAINIYRSLEELLDSQLHMIVPFMSKLMLKEIQSIDLEMRREIIHLFVSLSQKCPSTVQYLSLIINSLISLMEQVSKQPQAHQTHQTVMNCFAIFIKQYNNTVLVYLPMIHKVVHLYKINHIQYQQCLQIFLSYGTLDDLSNLLDDSQINFDFFPKQPATYYFTIEPANPPMFKKLDSEELMTKFDTSQRSLKDEWLEWMRNTSVELLKQSPLLVLSPCCSIAVMYPQIAQDLYNIAFASVWQNLSDKHKEQMIQHLTKAISPSNKENIPLTILQTILNLAEFMQHDKEGLQIDISTLAELAERCMAFAKALYYRELEFEYASRKTIQSLISLYTNLGLQESANGLLIFAKQNLKIQMRMVDYYERLQMWEEALKDYRQQQLSSEEKDQQHLFISKVRCFNALMQWHQVINQTEIIFDDTTSVRSVQTQKEVAKMACNAAMHLGQWDKLDKYNQLVQDGVDRPFWSAAVCISRNELDEAKLLVSKSREKLDGEVQGLLQESYERAQDKILKLQQLVEMEEIIELQQFESRVQRLENESKGEYSYLKLKEELENKKIRLRDIWSDRLAGAPKEVNVWYQILSTRQLYQPKIKDVDSWIKFARLALKREQMALCKETLEMLKNEINQNQDQSKQNIPFGLYLIGLECEYKQRKNEREIVERVRQYFKSSENIASIDSKIKAKTFFILGTWVSERTEVFTKENLDEINSLFDESLQQNPSYAKAWHHYALTNFEAAEYFSAICSPSTESQQKHPQYPSSPNITHLNQSQYITVDVLHKHVFDAVKGFIKSISLGFKHDKRGSYILQDTLRLLNLVFKYGKLPEIAKEFTDSFKQIDIIAWITVVPQILARIQIQDEQTQSLLHHLLIHISHGHPQALIYPLTVACKSKNQVRRIAVLKILEDMKTHSATLVNEALLISEELNRTAILLKESWREGIQEAWNSYFQDKNKTHVERILRGLHENMRVKPESLSEVSFHQTYGAEIFEAEAWFQRYLKIDDEVSLCQAFDIYISIYHKISATLKNLTTVHLENVSPKLLATQNCEISVPGLFKPNSPIVKISGFQPKLNVMQSKASPRKLYIYGNDGKEYTFLLKGHEDLRQDERVMQLFAMVNTLLTNDPETERKDLEIMKYSVIPLSHNTGIIGWVQNCDTLQVLIRDYRDSSSIRANTEAFLMGTFCDKYELLPMPNKVEIFRHILENTRGEDIQKVLWLKSQNSETWLGRRTNYTRSLATMSMVGYLLGLGDRHPSNVMLQRQTGKIVHIDFGDCFEVAMKREKFPEKIPFRLTRMLVKAMEACGIEGVYRHTCNIVMRVLRDNKESLLAVLDSFVYDPLLTWKLLNTASTNMPKMEKEKLEIERTYPQFLEQVKEKEGGSLIQKVLPPNRRNTIFQKDEKEENKENQEIGKLESIKSREKELYFEFADEEREIPDDLQNQKGLEVIERIKKKLQGRDFKDNEVLKYEDQVNKLILQATSHENIAQAYIGWCPFW